ncbi:MAG: phosphotriesterase-related protein [archaeon]|nr:phosphotriesterase-related protein [archaeon]
MKKAQSILGPVSEEQLGFTLAHEHLITNPPLWKIKEEPDFLLNDLKKSITELESFRSVGGKTIVEGTAIDWGRNVRALLEIAEKVKGVNIIATTGFNRGDYFDRWFYEWSVEDLTQLVVRDVTQGIDETNAKAGVIKIGTSYNNILAAERKAIRVAGRAHMIVRAPIMAHTTLGTMALEQLKMLEEEDVDPRKVAFIHMDQNLDLWYYEKVLKKGAFIEFDGPSKVKYYSDELRINYLNKLIEKGYEDQILISGDMGRRSYLRAYGGGPGLTFIVTEFIPRLREHGWDDKLIDKIFIKNPATYLAFLD